jgi:TrmH family RNA methyltransferase
LYDSLAPVEHGAGILVEIAFARPDLPVGQAVDAVYLDGVQHPGNVGTLLRTAAGAGVRHVAASTGTAFLWAPKVLRAAMGAHFAVSIYEDVSPDRLVHGDDELQDGLWRGDCQGLGGFARDANFRDRQQHLLRRGAK